MRIHYTFLFSQQYKPHAAIDALFSPAATCQPFTLGIGDEFIYRQTMNTTLYYWSQALFLSVIMTNDLYSSFAPSVVGMVDSYGATYNKPPAHRNTFARRNGLY